MRVAAASGFNGAVARTDGLIATALLGRVLAAHGPVLVVAFDGAMIACAAGCAGAALSAFALLKNQPTAFSTESDSRGIGGFPKPLR